MKTLITLYTVKDLPKKLYHELHNANFGSRGVMQGALEEARENSQTDEAYCIVVKSEDNKLVGWSLIMQEHYMYSSTNKTELIIWMWTEPEFRGQDYATLMIAYGLRKFPKHTLWFTPHDDISRNFASKLDKMYSRFKVVKRS